MSRPHLARINDWLWVGNCESCPTFEGAFVIHIYRNDKEVKDHPSQERFCRYDGRKNLRMNYRDGDELDASNLANLDAFIGALIGKPHEQRWREGLLIHCHAGMCRSPTVAIHILSVIEGMHPIDAQAKITKAIYEQRQGEVCNICRDPLRQILRLWEAR